MVREGNIDVDFSKISPEGIGTDIVAALECQGFCVCDAGISDDLLQAAIADIQDCETKGKLVQPPALITDGLFGDEGTSKMMEMNHPDARAPDETPNLFAIDAKIAETCSMMQEYVPQLGFSITSRSQGYVCVTDAEPMETLEINEYQASQWLSCFTRSRLMMITVLGPVKGTLNLEPFEEGIDALELPTVPGTTIILNTDMMLHKHFANSKSFLLASFLMEPKPSGKLGVLTGLYQTPCAKAIEEWSLDRMQQLKLEEYDRSTIVDVPRAWSEAMDHSYHVAQRVAIRGMSGRYPSTWKLHEWIMCQTSGIDFVQEVPMKRWRMEEYYNADPESWRWGQSWAKHITCTDGIELFDSRFFGLSPAEAAGMDPHQREVLECGYEACQSAGYKKGKLMNSIGGVYLGSSMTIFGMVSEVSGATGGAASINSNRFSFCLGMKGPSMTCDTDNSASLSAVYIGAEAVLEKGRGTLNEFSLAGGVHFELGTMWWCQHMSAGLLSQQGRCMTWDQSADGYCFGDGVGFVIAKRLTETVDGQIVTIEDDHLVGTIAGSTMNTNGLNSTMSAPSAPAEMELVSDCIKQAGISPLNIECIECNGEGNFMADAIEVDALNRVLRQDAYNADVPFGVTAQKTRMGQCIEASGISSLCRAMMSNLHGYALPNLHLHQINPHVEPENKTNYLTEVIEMARDSTYYGVTCRGFGGTNVHVLAYGKCDVWKLPELAEEQKPVMLNFWPAGGGSLDDDMIASGYFIAGTFNGWTPEKMSETAGGFGYTVTMGENRWEDFVVMLDRDVKRTLHPKVSRGGKGSPCAGPDAEKQCFWRINAMTSWVDSEASKLELTAGDSGKPGDKYQVMLKVAGKFKTVAWTKLPDSDPSAVKAGEYSIAANWNGYTFEKMTKDGDSWSLEVMLLRYGGEFQIVRNNDWHQVICPTTPKADADVAGFGPEDSIGSRGYGWYIGGEPGDVFKINYTREFGEMGADTCKVSWSQIRTESLTPEQKILAARPHFGVVGTWNGWVGPMQELGYEGQGYGAPMCFAFHVVIGSTGQESFQILQDLDWDNVAHPSRYADSAACPHYVLYTSPNDGSCMNLVWTIGEKDEAHPGAFFIVRVYSQRGGVVQVTWSKAEAPMPGIPVVGI